VPELTAKSFLEVVPLAFTLALILLLQYTVLRSALNLSGQLSLVKTMLMVVKLTISKAFLDQERLRSVLLAGIDQVNDHLDIDDIFPAISSQDEAPFVAELIYPKTFMGRNNALNLN
jgi:hypothetical protein